MMTPSGRRLLLVCLGFLALASCAAPKAVAPPVRGPAPRPLVLHLPGVAGPTHFDRLYLRALAEAWPEAEIQMYDWTAGDPGMGALHAYQRNKEQAGRLAEELARRWQTDDRQQIYLSGHSGGSAIAVWLLENLPAPVKVQSLLLLAPALSPQYDLSDALRHVADKAYAFSSPGDKVVLGAGTRIFGTMDQVRSEAAGLSGFVRPTDADVRQYEKLIAMPYRDEWLRLGNIGDHVGVLSVPFVRQVLLPLWHKDQTAAGVGSNGKS